MKNILKLGALLLGATIMAGCTVIPTATPAQKQAAMEKIAATDKAMIYLIRSEKGLYHAHTIEVEVGNKSLYAPGKSFSVFNLDAYKGKMKTDIIDIIGSDAELMVDLKAGQKHYYHLSKHYRPLIGPRAELVELSETEAKSLMQKYPMILEPRME
jgi:hypothetical protein